jgi:hypothetical protein
VTDTSDLARQLGAALGAGYTVQGPLGEGGFGVVLLRFAGEIAVPRVSGFPAICALLGVRESRCRAIAAVASPSPSRSSNAEPIRDII